jgi:hypothetical protein
MYVRSLKTGSLDVVRLVSSSCGKDVGLWGPQRANSAGNDSAVYFYCCMRAKSGAPDLLRPSFGVSRPA